MSDAYNVLHRHHFGDREMRVLNATKCLRAVRAHIPFESVVDFGCGIGHWLEAARQLGARQVLGIEGDWIKATPNLLDPSEIRIADLATETIALHRAFDLAVSIEVGEHLPAASADLFCDNLVNAANVLVFSAAIIGQTGVNHINEQKPRYWVDRFWDRGFIPLELVRPAISGEPKMYSWLQQNVMVFMNHDLLHLTPRLAQFALPRRHFYVRYREM